MSGAFPKASPYIWIDVRISCGQVGGWEIGYKSDSHLQCSPLTRKRRVIIASATTKQGKTLVASVDSACVDSDANAFTRVCYYVIKFSRNKNQSVVGAKLASMLASNLYVSLGDGSEIDHMATACSTACKNAVSGRGPKISNFIQVSHVGFDVHRTSIEGSFGWPFE